MSHEPLARLRELLDPNRTPVEMDDSRGYLDLLGRPEAPSIALRAMQAPWLAAIYEDLWRPMFSRAFSWGRADVGQTDRLIAARVGRPGERLVLDVACGPGLHTRQFARALSGDGLCVGLDYSPAMLSQAVRTTVSEHVAFLRADAHQIPFPDNTFDDVVCLAALYLIPDPLTVIDELCRVVAPGGSVTIFTTVSSRRSMLLGYQAVGKVAGVRFFGRHEVTNRLRANGLINIEQTITGDGQYVTGQKI